MDAFNEKVRACKPPWPVDYHYEREDIMRDQENFYRKHRGLDPIPDPRVFDDDDPTFECSAPNANDNSLGTPDKVGDLI